MAYPPSMLKGLPQSAQAALETRELFASASGRPIHRFATGSKTNKLPIPAIAHAFLDQVADNEPANAGLEIAKGVVGERVQIFADRNYLARSFQPQFAPVDMNLFIRPYPTQKSQ